MKLIALRSIKGFGVLILLLATISFARADEASVWKPASPQLMTRWGASVNPTNVLAEYPRPQMTRPDWMNLNGLWDYAVTTNSVEQAPSMSGKILVPFPIESALSGVKTNL